MGIEIVFKDSNGNQVGEYFIKWLVCRLNYDITDNNTNM